MSTSIKGEVLAVCWAGAFRYNLPRVDIPSKFTPRSDSVMLRATSQTQQASVSMLNAKVHHQSCSLVEDYWGILVNWATGALHPFQSVALYSILLSWSSVHSVILSINFFFCFLHLLPPGLAPCRMVLEGDA